MQRVFSHSEALEIGRKIGIDFRDVDLEQFHKGLAVELEHGSHDVETNITNDNLYMTGKIAWQHLKELPDYYSRLSDIEEV